MFYESAHVLSIKLAFDNALKLNRSLAFKYKMIVTEMQKANANFKEVLSVAQTIAPPHQCLTQSNPDSPILKINHNCYLNPNHILYRIYKVRINRFPILQKRVWF
jgi:hypothetical protein